MRFYHYLIIGGGIAGVTAAETIREEDPDATIGIISQEPYPLYSRVLLPAYLKGKIAREQLFLRTSDDFLARRIDLHLHEEVASIDTKHSSVMLANGISFEYEKLLIATGGRLQAWGQPEDQGMVYRLQTISDAERLFHALPQITNPLVIGASFISLEFLDIFAAHRLAPHMLVRDTHLFGRYVEEQGAALLEKNCERHGVTIHTGDTMRAIDPAKHPPEVATAKGAVIVADAIAVGVGLDLNIDFLNGSGITTGSRGILVNEFLETNQPGISAAGDVTEFFDVITQTHRVVGNWTNAFLQGKRAGLNMTGRREAFRNVSSYSITNLGSQITALGECRQNGKAEGIEEIIRFDFYRNRYERLVLKDDILIGAVLINQFSDKPHLTHLIASRTQLSAYRERLSDSSFDIRTIAVVS